MGRIQFVELHDLPACPRSLRDALTDFLAFTLNLARAYEFAGPLLRRAIARTRAQRVVDLCSGAGGPWRWLAAQVGVPVLLTDLYPHAGAALHAEPIDARAVPAALTGLRTMFTAFHHFRPAEARAIFEDAVRRRQGIAVFEAVGRKPLDILLVACTWIAVLLLVPFVRPFRWSRLFWTYLPPVLPLVGSFDGVVSCLRMYSRAELAELLRGLDDFEWEIGETRSGWSPLKSAYVIGVPKEGLAD